MAIKTKCQRCGRFVANGESCCGALKKVKVERKPKEQDEFQAEVKPTNSLAEDLFGDEEDEEEEEE